MERLLWIQKQDFGPAPRTGHALAFDVKRSRVVLFGGSTTLGSPSTLLGDTWEWDGENWTQVDDIGPSARKWFAVACDSNRNRVVLFGGLSNDGPSGETWEWDGQDWTQVSETGPSPRILHAMAFDSSQNIVTLFGGQSQLGDPQTGTNSTLNDTWEWNGSDWTQQEDTGPDRSTHTMAYDDVRNRLVLFGGVDALGQEHGDTWEWNGASWTQRSTFGPPARMAASLVFNGAECLLFGGTERNTPQKQTWTWDGTHWTARQDIGPSARSGHATAFDSARGRIVLFGGQGQAPTPFGDTWEQKAEDAPAAQPPPLALTSFTVAPLSIRFEDAAVPGGAAFSGSASVQLSRPASAGGAVIALSISRPTEGFTVSSGIQTTIPEDQTTIQIPFKMTSPNGIRVDLFPIPLTAILQNGNLLSTTWEVSVV